MTKSKRLISALAIVAFGWASIHAADNKNIFTRRFIRLTGNLKIQSQYDAVLQRATTAAQAGYNGMFLDNSSIWTISKQDANFVNKVKQFDAAIKGLGMVFMPYSLGQGEQSMMSFNNTVAHPVRGTPFVVSGGTATVKADPAANFTNGGFETLSGIVPATWKFSGITPNVTFFVDNSTVNEGSNSVRVEKVNKKDVVLSQNIPVKPWRSYRITAMLKTRGMNKTRNVGFRVIGTGSEILKEGGNNGIPGNSGSWIRHEVDFPSLKNSAVKILFTLWPVACSTGTIWADNVKMEEVGLYELHMGRPSLKVTVKSADGGQTYTQGKDYTITYKMERQYQSKLTIPAGSAIKNGQELSVDWYALGDTHSRVWPAATFCSEETWTSARANVKALHDAIGPLPGWFNKLSEWRDGNWDPACPGIYKNLSEYQGKTQKRCVDLVREYSPKVENYIWNDAFDPYHNGLGPYALNNGELVNGWEYLHPETVILNWNEGKKRESLKFFSGMDPNYPGVFYHQLISFWAGGNATGWLSLLDSLEDEGMFKNAVIGIQYTTWGEADYDKIKPYADEAKETGRWATNKDPFQGVERPVVAGVAAPDGAIFRMTVRNAFRGKAAISYEIPFHGRVKLSVLNAQGQLVQKLEDRKARAGKQTVHWETHDRPAGVFFIRLEVEDGVECKRSVRKLVVL